MNTTATLPLAVRMNNQRARLAEIAADRRELDRLDLIESAALADIETESTAALPALRQKLAEARQARQRILAREYGGTTAGRDERRAAVHHVHHERTGTTDTQRAALARSLADGCTRMRWSGERTAHVKLARDLAVVTSTVWTVETLTGQDARTGQRGTGTPMRAFTAAVTVVPADLRVTQDGTLVVVDGVEVGTRDSSRDETCNAVRRQSTTGVRMASRDGHVLQRAGVTGLEAWQHGTDMIETADAADREADKHAEIAERAAVRMEREHAARARLAAAGLNTFTR